MGFGVAALGFAVAATAQALNQRSKGRLAAEVRRLLAPTPFKLAMVVMGLAYVHVKLHDAGHFAGDDDRWENLYSFWGPLYDVGFPYDLTIQKALPMWGIPGGPWRDVEFGPSWSYTGLPESALWAEVAVAMAAGYLAGAVLHGVATRVLQKGRRPLHPAWQTATWLLLLVAWTAVISGALSTDVVWHGLAAWAIGAGRVILIAMLSAPAAFDVTRGRWLIPVAACYHEGMALWYKLDGFPSWRGGGYLLLQLTVTLAAFAASALLVASLPRSRQPGRPLEPITAGPHGGVASTPNVADATPEAGPVVGEPVPVQE